MDFVKKKLDSADCMVMDIHKDQDVEKLLDHPLHSSVCIVTSCTGTITTLLFLQLLRALALCISLQTDFLQRSLLLNNFGMLLQT